MKFSSFVSLLVLLTSLVSHHAAAKTAYVLEDEASTLIGQPITVTSSYEDTLLDVARRHGLGYQDIKLVNPELDTWLPGEGKTVNLPLQFVLPDTPKQGLVLNIPEMRLYHYSKNDAGQLQVMTFPLGVGREGWSTPFMKTRIIEKKQNPKWFPPESIREEHEQAGDPLPKIVEAGPDNPLGAHAMRLGKPEYLIHGTNKPFGIGMRVSHGCIRLYPEDIAFLFDEVKLGTPVEIINQPFKVGKHKDELYLEVHPYLDEDREQYQGNLTPIVELIVSSMGDKDYKVDWDRVRLESTQPSGLPVLIGALSQEILDNPANNWAAPLKASPVLNDAVSTQPDALIKQARSSQEDKLKELLEGGGIELQLDSRLKME